MPSSEAPEARPTVLLADDEPAITSNLAAFLERSGFDVTVVGDGGAALEAVDRRTPDLVVLDVMMPVADGRAVLRSLREREIFVPVVLLTQVGESGERARALEEGADDYVNKPFDPNELAARMRAVLRRARPGQRSLAASHKLASGPLSVDRTSHRAWLQGKELSLTPKAMLLLDYLITHPDEVLTRDRLLEVLWGFDHPVGTRAVDNRVLELRRALADDAGAPAWIETVPGLGYRFCAGVSTA